MSDYSAELLADFRQISTATLTTVLIKRGIRNVWIRGAVPMLPGQERIAGPAFTMRFIPSREDLATPAAWSSPTSSRAAVEAVIPGSIAVVDAGGCQDAGIFGDILVARMQARGVTGLVSDGVIRDREGVLGTGFPVWSSGTAAPPAIAGLHFTGWQDPIGCGGVAVFPGDLIVADGDGAVVVPADLVEEIHETCLKQEKLEAWIVEKVSSGEALTGLYPTNEERLEQYRAETGEKP